MFQSECPFGFLEWIAENVAADIVKTMNLAITSLDCVVVVVRMDIMGLAVMTVRYANNAYWSTQLRN